MYYPLGLPKQLKFPYDVGGEVKQIICNRDRILYAVITEKVVWIWFSKPCVPITGYFRENSCLEEHGTNCYLEWRPHSSMFVIATSKGFLLFYSLQVEGEVYKQVDSSNPTLRRETAELYTREHVPSVLIKKISELKVTGDITCIVNLRDEIMVSSSMGYIHRVRWDGTCNSDYSVDLRRVPFCDDQLVMRALPLDAPGIHIVDLEYSPLVGGFATVLSDGRAAFLTASTLQFDPNAVQGIWAKGIEDATCAAINHKYRLLAYGRDNSEGIVYMVDEASGGLEVSHYLILSKRDYSGSPGAVEHMKWTPDGTVLGMCWKNGGLSLWSVFGSLLTASLRWDYSQDPRSYPLVIKAMEWGPEGYELWCNKRLDTAIADASIDNSANLVNTVCDIQVKSCVILLSFVKSALSVNPCMSRLERIILQGSDRLYLNTLEGIELKNHMLRDSLSFYFEDDEMALLEPETGMLGPCTVTANKQWIVIPTPHTYTSSNWPIRV